MNEIGRKQKGQVLLPPKNDVDAVYELLEFIPPDLVTQQVQLATLRVTTKKEKLLFLVFRGSTNTQDWLYNVSSTIDWETFRACGLGVHAGWASILSDRWTPPGVQTLNARFLDRIRGEIENHGCTGIVVTGHSLGGGLAKIAMLKMRLIAKALESGRTDSFATLAIRPSNVQKIQQFLLDARCITLAAPNPFAKPKVHLEHDLYFRERSDGVVNRNHSSYRSSAALPIGRGTASFGRYYCEVPRDGRCCRIEFMGNSFDVYQDVKKGDVLSLGQDTGFLYFYLEKRTHGEDTGEHSVKTNKIERDHGPFEGLNLDQLPLEQQQKTETQKRQNELRIVLLTEHELGEEQRKPMDETIEWLEKQTLNFVNANDIVPRVPNNFIGFLKKVGVPDRLVYTPNPEP